MNGRLFWLEDGYSPTPSGRSSDQMDRSIRRLVSEAPNGSDRRPILTLEENGRRLFGVDFLSVYNGRLYCAFQAADSRYWDDEPRESFGEIVESSSEKIRPLLNLPRGANPISINDGVLYFEIEESDDGWWAFSRRNSNRVRVLYKYKLG